MKLRKKVRPETGKAQRGRPGGGLGRRPLPGSGNAVSRRGMPRRGELPNQLLVAGSGGKPTYEGVPYS